jgi:hypothetical protein
MRLFKVVDFGEMFCRMREMKFDTLTMSTSRNRTVFKRKSDHYNGHIPV